MERSGDDGGKESETLRKDPVPQPMETDGDDLPKLIKSCESKALEKDSLKVLNETIADFTNLGLDFVSTLYLF